MKWTGVLLKIAKGVAKAVTFGSIVTGKQIGRAHV